MSTVKGMTLFEIIIVLVIIAVSAAFFLPNFTNPTEHANAVSAQNNLLAVYTSQLNYYNNYNSYCLSTGLAQPSCQTAVDTNCADNETQINCSLNLNIQDTAYTYSCNTDAVSNTGFSCIAKRVIGGNTVLTLTLTNKPTLLTSTPALNNPSCTVNAAPATTAWCP